MIDPKLVTDIFINPIVTYAAFNRMMLDYMFIFFDKTFYMFLSIGIILSTIYLIMCLNVVGYKHENEKEEKLERAKAPFVTIQIPTRNEIVALRCAKRCLDFDYPKERFEILIGDDSNDEKISRELDEFAKKHKKVKIIRRKENIGYKPGNLNNMLKYSRGEILVIFDSDFIPESDFLQRIVAPFTKDDNVSAVQARWKFINAEKNIITVLASTIVYTFHHITLSFLKKHELGLLCGSAEAVRKKDLVSYGGWRSGSLTEDIEYSLRIHKHGKKIKYLPRLSCYNEAPSRPLDLYKQQMRWAHGVISSYKVHSKDLLSTNNLTPANKLFTFIGAFGYFLPVIIILCFVTGIFSLVTHRPAPVDWVKLFSELSRNVILTSGLLIASSVALYRAGKFRLFSRMLISSFSVGLVTTYYVNKGIIEALMNKPMEWYLLNKSNSVEMPLFLNRKK